MYLALAGHDPNEVRQVFQFLAAWITRAPEHSLVLLTERHLTPAGRCHARRYRHPSTLHVRLVVSGVAVDALTGLQVFKEQRTELPEDLEVGINECAIQVEEKEPREDHLIDGRSYALTTEDWLLSSIRSLFYLFHLVKIIYNLQVSDYL